LVRFKI